MRDRPLDETSARESREVRDPERHRPATVRRALVVGRADDPVEAEADRVAERVADALRRPAPAEAAPLVGRIRRAPGAVPAGAAPTNRAIDPRIDRGTRTGNGPETGPEGGPLSADTTDRIRRAAGRGEPMPDELRSRAEHAFGADLAHVRLYRSSDLAPRLGADAFTAGSDIHLAPGRYRPEGRAGLHLLAHELTHVVQQRGHDHIETPPQVRAARRSDVVRASFSSSMKAAGAKIASAASAVKAGFATTKKTLQNTRGFADPQPDAPTDDPVVDSQSHERREAWQRTARGGSPGENPDYANPALFGTDPDRFVVTVAVSQSDPEWMRNIDALKAAAIRTIVGSPKLAATSSAEELKLRVARDVLTAKGDLDGQTEDEVEATLEQFTAGLYAVGHAWVRLSTYVGGTLKELYSYGMWPQKVFVPYAHEEAGGFDGLLTPGPGEVRHPDIAHEDDDHKAYLDHEVDERRFRAAHRRAIARYDAPPPYVLTGYNCTAFAREIVKTAGKSFPGAGVLPGFAYTPGGLYWAIIDKVAKHHQNARTTENEPAAMAAITAKNAAFVEAGEQHVTDEYDVEDPDEAVDPGAPRHTALLRAGRWLRVGERPNVLDQNVRIEADMTVVGVLDRNFLGRWDAVPLEFGPVMRYADLSGFVRAQQPSVNVGVYEGDAPPRPDARPVTEMTSARAEALLVPVAVHGPWVEVRYAVDGTERTGWVLADDLDDARLDMAAIRGEPTAGSSGSDDHSSDSDSDSDDVDDLDVHSLTEEEVESMLMPLLEHEFDVLSGTDPEVAFRVFANGNHPVDVESVVRALMGTNAGPRRQRLADLLGCQVDDLLTTFAVQP